ncbi:HK97 family phage prohead protease [Streptomyces shenzhenensis]|uniref:HK97 family phage prohead protease n=1 Tax=Streptomyces shenzhenensis TaxID=943815 RepID=UPI003D8AB188
MKDLRGRHYTRGFVQRATADGGDVDKAMGTPLPIVAATAGRKADGLNLVMDGVDLGRFEGNPVIGYGHSYWGIEGLPKGRAENTRVDGEQLLMDVVFDQDDEFARKIERKYRQRFLNAFSIGFDVHDIADDGTVKSWELYEVSAVPLPMDPNALVADGRTGELALARALGLDQRGPAADAFAQAVLGQLAGLQIGDLRAGAVLSKKNKTLVQNAVDALTELLDAAGSDDDAGDGRGIDPEMYARALRLAGIEA